MGVKVMFFCIFNQFVDIKALFIFYFSKTSSEARINQLISKNKRKKENMFDINYIYYNYKLYPQITTTATWRNFILLDKNL